MKARERPRSRSGDHYLTPALRRKLKRPLGILFPSSSVGGEEFLSLLAGASMVVAVGDRVTETLQVARGRSPDVFVVDGRERRTLREVPRIAHASTIKAKNPSGQITRSAKAALHRAFSGAKPAMVLIDGEEDLLAIPAVIEAPLGAVVFYGQPAVGVVAVVVDDKAKASARGTLGRMSSKPKPL